MTRREKKLTPEMLHAMVRQGTAPLTPAALHELLRVVFNIEIATGSLLPGSAAPFEYLVHTFFEGTMAMEGVRPTKWREARRPADCVVWAARGAGKTSLGAVATTLDLVFKAGIEVRILGGSLEQSQRMHEHLRRLFEIPDLAGLLAEKITDRRIVLRNGSRAQILAQSQTSVRGTRVQKLRCDEVELFDPEVWNAAQLTTRSMRLAGPWGQTVRGSVEALSTMHRPFGLMWNLVGDAAGHDGRPTDRDRADKPKQQRRMVFRWGLIDVLARCGPAHVCGACPIEPECGGRAKQRDRNRHARPGHVSVDDAVRMKSRVGASVWESEMLCLRPRRSDCVLPEFDPAIHVGDWAVPPEAAAPRPEADHRPAFDPAPAEPTARRRWVAGMDFGIRSPTVLLLAWYREDDPHRVLYVEAEHVRTDWTIEQHARILLGAEAAPGWPNPAPEIEWIGVDPAGNQRSEQTGVSSISALRKAGLPVRWRRLRLHQGLDLLRVRLSPAATAAGGAPGQPRLFVHRRCAKLAESLTKYHYPEGRPESLEPAKDGSDHAVDALRYLVACLDHAHVAKLSAY
jgi:hypothetical protein